MLLRYRNNLVCYLFVCDRGLAVRVPAARQQHSSQLRLILVSHACAAAYSSLLKESISTINSMDNK